MEPYFLKKVMVFAKGNLAKSPLAQAYLKSRGVSLELCYEHDVGFFSSAPPYPPKEWTEYANYMAWRSRAQPQSIVFPVRDYEGKIIGLSLRSIEGKEHHSFLVKNSRPKGVFFDIKKSLHIAYKKQWCLLVEGQTDYLSVRTHIPNSLATMTASVSAGQAKVLRRFVSTVVLGTDNDGKRETERAMEQSRRTLEENGLVVVVQRPVYKDWNEFLQKAPMDFETMCIDLNNRMEVFYE